jgi:hypothetical protein
MTTYDFLTFIHDQLIRMASLNEAVDELSEEDRNLLSAIGGTATIIMEYANQTSDSNLYQIGDDFEYSVNHIGMKVYFKAASVLEEAKLKIEAYK